MTNNDTTPYGLINDLFETIEEKNTRIKELEDIIDEIKELIK